MGGSGLAVVVATAILAFENSTLGPFVFDDSVAITGNPGA